MQNLLKRILIQVAIIAVSLWLILPLAEKMRLGRDLAGGVSLVYTVQLGDNEDAAVVMPKVTQALKDRVDPNGVLEIQIFSLGRDRLEITMPLPRPEVKELRAAFEAELTKIGKFKVTPARLSNAFGLAGEQRAAAMAELSAGNPTLRDKLSEAAGLFDERNEIDRKLASLAADAPATERNDLIAKRAEINPKYRDAVQLLQNSVLSPESVRKVLELPTAGRKIAGYKDKELVDDPSQQSVKLGELRERFPLRLTEINAAVKAYESYVSKRKTLDDPQDLKRLLRGSGELSFRIPVPVGIHPEEGTLRQELQEKGPATAKRADARWFKINQISNWYESAPMRDLLRVSPAGFFQQRKLVGEAYLDGYYVLCWDTANAKMTSETGEWSIASAGDTRDDRGLPAVSFTMDARGAKYLGDLTRQHVGEPMAVLLDDEVYTAPNLNSEISKNGIIQGVSQESERRYIIKVMSAGALAAKLSPEPISESTQSPQLGADNLRSGLNAGVIALVTIGTFMIVYYFTSGVLAVIALVVNALIIMGLMSLNKATYTMPGIAGVILTFGMAVDANVLIYERIREELRGGVDFKTAVRLGFSRAFSSIVDGNITNLIVCFVLYFFGSAEVKGFAITMSIGGISTLWAGLVFSRLLFDGGLALGWRKTSMLPMAVPALQRMLTPSIKWTRLRYYFFAFSTVYVCIGLGAVFFRGGEMLDTEFRGGTVVDIVLKPVAEGSDERITLTRSQVVEKLREAATNAESAELKELGRADVVTINPKSDGVTSDHFKIKTLVTDTNLVLRTVQDRFREYLDTAPPLTFTHAVDDKPPFYPIDASELGTVINRPLPVPLEIREYRGGVAIVLDSLSPQPTLASIKDRLSRTRLSSAYSGTLTRTWDVVVLKGDERKVEAAVVLVKDASVGYDPLSPQAWQNALAKGELQLAVDALAVASTPASVQSFSSSIAATFRVQAVVAVTLSFLLITIYIWVRFGTARYALAALIALIHDVLVVIGLIAVCEFMYENESTAAIARQLGLLPFKIDLNMIAAVLTVAGYSLNDTIIVMDRIRESRGKALEANEDMINNAVNHTISRTLITSGTTIASSVILYMFGGEGVRAFAFALVVGILVGTYSSIAVAAPIVWVRRKAGESADLARPADPA